MRASVRTGWPTAALLAFGALGMGCGGGTEQPAGSVMLVGEADEPLKGQLQCLDFAFRAGDALDALAPTAMDVAPPVDVAPDAWPVRALLTSSTPRQRRYFEVVVRGYRGSCPEIGGISPVVVAGLRSAFLPGARRTVTVKLTAACLDRSCDPGQVCVEGTCTEPPTVDLPPSDGGVDGGRDGATDGGSDGGVDARPDAGSDAAADGGGLDGGTDAGSDAGSDAAADGGGDGGPPPCGSDAECLDDDACTIDSCEDGVCVHRGVGAGDCGCRAVAVSLSATHACAVDGTGRLWCWGRNDYRQIADTTRSVYPSPQEVSSDDWSAVLSVAAGSHFTCVLAVDSSGARGVWCWGSCDSGRIAVTGGVCGTGYMSGNTQPTPTRVGLPIGGSVDVTQVVAGANFACALTSTGKVYCWGKNDNGQIGQGDSVGFSSSPQEVSGLSGVDELAAGSYHACARTGTTVRCWGSNNLGQSGQVLTQSKVPTPRPVGSVNAIAIFSRFYNTCAITTSGLKCWGLNAQGQIGNGTTSDGGVPTPTLASWEDMWPAARQSTNGWGHTCAVDVAGTLRCWGANDDGQLGDGTTMQRLTPTDVAWIGERPFVVRVAGGIWNSCAIDRLGQLWCWGDAGDGLLGTGNTLNDAVNPQRVYWDTCP